MTMVTICSKLATSLVLNHPLDLGTHVTIRGVNSAPRGKDKQPIWVPYMTTQIDAEFWDAWEQAHGLKSRKPFSAIKSGALYMAESEDHAKGIYKEQAERHTGFEGMSRDGDPRMGKAASQQVATAAD